MDKRISSRAIIIENDQLLAFFRRKVKDGITKEYYAIPGGGLETGESINDNVKRELKEELNVDINILGYVGKAEDDTSITYYFHCEIISGIPVLSGEEKDRANDNNYYKIIYLPMEKIDNYGFYNKDLILKAYNKEYILLND
ncbi:MAG: NUDIX domain-containing protein [Mollicutes bacterium]|nr:NUDIX domain-containing protein [Mollicutes bacterium]